MPKDEDYKLVSYNAPAIECAITDLYGAFNWSSTPEGVGFWSDIVDRLEAIQNGGKVRPPLSNAQTRKAARTKKDEEKLKYSLSDNRKGAKSNYYPE